MKLTKFFAFGLLALTCVGCSTAKTMPATENAKSQATDVAQRPAARATQNAAVVTPEPNGQTDATTTVGATTSVSTAVFSVDDTWNTYANAALKFEFKWPTKGTYAPVWSVAFGKEGDGLIKDGCAIDANHSTKTMNEDFCHSTSIVDTGDRMRTDYFATKKGNQYIIIKLQKNLFAMSDKCKQAGVTTSANSCKEFKPTDYASLLDTIISTFKYTE